MSDPTESERPLQPRNDAGHDAQSLLARGDLLLKQLSEEATAARAEAKKAELERLLAEASSGNLDQLAMWLEQHTPEPNAARADSSRPSLPEAKPPTHHSTGSFSSDVGKQTAHSMDGKRINDWEPLRQLARQRLNDRFASPNRPAQATEPSTKKSTRRDAASPNLRGPHFASQPASPSTPTRKPESAKPNKQLVALAQTFTEEQQSEQKSQHRKTVFLSGMGGVVASAIAHVILIAILAFITLKMPSPPAGLAIQSASAEQAEDTFEVTEQMDIDAPDVDEPVTEPMASVDFASELTEAEQSSSDAISEMANSPATISAEMASAVGATSSVPIGTNSSFFGAASGGNTFCYVIDFSGSMRGGPWEAARAELLKSLASLEPKQRFYIILFNRDLLQIPEPGEREPAAYPLYATAENLEHAKRWLFGLSVGKTGKEPSDAIIAAIAKEPDAIYLLTDGETRVKNVADKIREANRIEDLISGEQLLTTIHTIAYYSLKGQQLLKQIAAENQGSFIYVPDPNE